MLQLLRSGLELVVRSGFVYVPLLYDPDIDREIQDRAEPDGPAETRGSGLSDNVVEVGGRQFIRSVSLQSIVANFEKIDKGYYERFKEDCLRQLSGPPAPESIAPDSKLMTIVLKVMPYFIRKSRGFERKPLNDEELLDLISDRIDIPPSFSKQVDNYFDSGPLRQKLNELGKVQQTTEPLQDGPVAGDAIQQWLRQALEVQIVNRERIRLEQELHERERMGESKRKHIATLLYIAERGSLELDGFGFHRMDSKDDYLIYRRTGPYILKDYYGRAYLFPDCRVAVSTTRPFRPLVLEPYKHPFLQDYAPRQEICLRGFNWPEEFTADNIIGLLEEGINALLYGYDARRRNGYHSLDPTRHYIKTIEFEDYRVKDDQV